MARIRLAAGGGRHRCRGIYFSTENILEKWPVWTGMVQVFTLGSKEELPADLEEVVKAAGQEGRIERKELYALCKQRSSEGGSGCDALQEDLYLSSDDSPLKESPSTARQVSRSSRKQKCTYVRDICTYSQEFEQTNKQTNGFSVPVIP